MDRQKEKVISVGGDEELLWLRNAVLRAAGFDVVTTDDEHEALRHIRHGDCGVLLMCYSLSRVSRQELAETFRQTCPDGRIVAITNVKMDQPEFADVFVYGVEGPEVLIDAIRNG
jgi:CheY-like chemotaxis protein